MVPTPKKQKLNTTIKQESKNPDEALINFPSSIMSGITEKDGLLSLTLKSITSVSLVQEMNYMMELINSGDSSSTSWDDARFNDDVFDYQGKLDSLKSEIELLKTDLTVFEKVDLNDEQNANQDSIGKIEESVILLVNEHPLNRDEKTKYLDSKLKELGSEFSQTLDEATTEEGLLKEYYEHFDDLIYSQDDYYTNVSEKINLDVKIDKLEDVVVIPTIEHTESMDIDATQEMPMTDDSQPHSQPSQSLDVNGTQLQSHQTQTPIGAHGQSHNNGQNYGQGQVQGQGHNQLHSQVPNQNPSHGQGQNYGQVYSQGHVQGQTQGQAQGQALGQNQSLGGGQGQYSNGDGGYSKYGNGFPTQNNGQL